MSEAVRNDRIIVGHGFVRVRPWGWFSQCLLSPPSDAAARGRKRRTRAERAREQWERLTDRGRYPADMVTVWSKHRYLEDADAPYRAFVDRLAVEDEGGTIERLDGESVHELRKRLLSHQESHWMWLGAHSNDGRGQVRIYGKLQPVSRVLWTWLRGGSPDTRRVLKRRCGRERCVNPFHHQLMRRGTWQEGWNGDPANRAPSGWNHTTGTV